MIVLITGATGGYGRALCQQAKADGHFVIAIGRSAEKLRMLVAQGHADRHHEMDFLNQNVEEKIGDLVHTLKRNNISHIDLLINNAGIGSQGASLLSETAQSIAHSLNVNCIAPFLLSALLLESFSLKTIVNISSRRGSVEQNADPRVSKAGSSYAYRISKSALNMLSLCITDEFGDRVACYAVHPGRLKTDLGVADATLAPSRSAKRLFDLVASAPPSNRFYSLEDEHMSVLPW
ncbi:SDR family NAD(P)-dependent oxidoreductase [Pseudomonas gingeri]|uniref:SDR family NAD(P)-dependent oxidoreductase n=1 Tax=Pseudomonas gingeri TaxID=117681 RepID=UPI0015A11609|nr:SDR family NAD(P)-dependent oxidoreductase [Pseudomonas gingeri]NWD67259.1 SDR family NAD(P)-dependent oxidoreductase [Pseudomonas gingeri]